MSNELVQVPFHGDVLEAVQQDGYAWLSVRRACENLGMAWERQMAKLKTKSWAVVTMMVTTGTDGKSYEMLMLRHDCVPIWLATIDTNRVKKDVRERLDLYQKEAAKALADWFFGTPKPSTVPANLDDLAESVGDRLMQYLAPRLAMLAPRPPEPAHTIADRTAALGWTSATRQDRDRVRNLALALIRQAGYPRPVRESESPSAELLIPASQSHLLDDAVLRVWRQAELTASRPHAPSLPFPVSEMN